jgi:hypothetical protein
MEGCPSEELPSSSAVSPPGTTSYWYFDHIIYSLFVQVSLTLFFLYCIEKLLHLYIRTFAEGGPYMFILNLWYRLPYWFQTLVAFILVLGGGASVIFVAVSSTVISDPSLRALCAIVGVFTGGFGLTLLYSIRQNWRWEMLDRERRLLELKEKWDCADVIAERMVPDISDDDEERAALDWRRNILAKGLVRDYPLHYLRWLRTSEKGAPPQPKESA